MSRKVIADCLKRASAFLFSRKGYGNHTFELGLKAWGSRRADLVANKVNGMLVVVEVKSGIEDFKGDQKMHTYLEHCDWFYLATTEQTWLKISTTPELLARLPASAGVITLAADGYAYIKRPARNNKITANARMLMLSRLAYRNADLSRRTNRARQRVYLPEL